MNKEVHRGTGGDMCRIYDLFGLSITPAKRYTLALTAADQDVDS